MHGGLKIRTGVTHASASHKSRISKIAALAKNELRRSISQRARFLRVMADIGVKPAHLFGYRRRLRAVICEPPSFFGSQPAREMHDGASDPWRFTIDTETGLADVKVPAQCGRLEISGAEDARKRQ